MRVMRIISSILFANQKTGTAPAEVLLALSLTNYTPCFLLYFDTRCTHSFQPTEIGSSHLPTV